jgi:hypothetical protein
MLPDIDADTGRTWAMLALATMAIIPVLFFIILDAIRGRRD